VFYIDLLTTEISVVTLKIYIVYVVLYSVYIVHGIGLECLALF